MKILILNGDCVQRNSSANLCHLAYIRGLLAAGHDVTLLSADGRDYTTDPAMNVPEQVTHYTIYGVSMYEKLSLKKRVPSSAASAGSAAAAPAGPGVLHKAIQTAKATLRSLYGVHGVYATFVRKAQKFRSDEQYDIVISLSTPVTSHLLTHNLLKAGHIHAKRWIQIWEDPWYSDVYGFNGKPAVYREERRLLSFAESVCYVSPLTLRNQQRLFPEAAHKMFWQPLPSYYREDSAQPELSQNHYGYFGDYYPVARDLRPFYEAATETGITVNICGNPGNLFAPTEDIHIYPRLPLDALRPIENDTNVLIFLCNRQGGQIPGKIYQYSATNKTILFILDGTEEEQMVLRDYFGQFHRYHFCQNTTGDIARAIREIESGVWGDIQNVPIAEFEPAKIIGRILKDGGSGHE